MNNMNNGRNFVVSREMLSQYDDVYTYGTYSPMDWLKNELLKIKQLLNNDLLIVIEDDRSQIEIRSIGELRSWIEKKFPELIQSIQ